jgi:hypothetical protein
VEFLEDHRVDEPLFSKKLDDLLSPNMPPKTAPRDARPMTDPQPPKGCVGYEPAIEYRQSSVHRRNVVGGCIGFSIFAGLPLLSFGLRRLRSPVPGDEPLALVLAVLMGCAVLAVCLLTALAALRAKRVAFLADRAELPPVSFFPPWCFLPPSSLRYSDVTRWGLARVTGGPIELSVLAFELGAPGGRLGKTLKLVSSEYADPAALFEEFQKRLPPPCEVRLGSVSDNPIFGLETPRAALPAPRERALSPAEVRAAGEAWQGTTAGRQRRLVVIGAVLVVAGVALLVIPRLLPAPDRNPAPVRGR